MGIIGKLIANFCAFFLAINILGQLIAFLSISEQMQPKQARKTLLNSAYFIFFVSLVIMFIGWILSALTGIRPVDMQISGGVLLLAFAVLALIRPDEEISIVKDSTFFPVTAQLIVTPVFFIMLLVLMSLNGFIITALSLFLNLLVVIYFFINSSKIVGLVGPGGIRTISRIVNILICSYAVMLIRVAITAMFS